MIKIVVDLSNLDSKKMRGQAMCSMNLLSGFNACKDMDFDLYVACEPGLEKNVLESCPRAKVLRTWRVPYTGSTNIVKLVIYYFLFFIYTQFSLPKLINSVHPDKVIFMHSMIADGGKYNKSRVIINPQDANYLTFVHAQRLRRRLWGYYCTYRYKKDLENADKIIAISDADKNEFLSYIPEYEAKITRIYDPMIFDSSYLETEPEEKTILVLNYAYDHKNGITIVKAFERIMNEVPHNLIMVGDINPECEAYVALHKLNDRIILTGRVSNDVRDHYLKSTSLYINASEHEGFGMTNVEASVFGRRILLVDNDVNREIIGNIATFYAPSRDDSELAKKILDNLKSNVVITPEQKQNLINKYSAEKIAREYLKV